MSGFNETMVLECNRLSSEEGKTLNNDNPALFTNKIGSGIKVNAGDTVSVYSAFISEKGAGQETIQFNGRQLIDKLNNPLRVTLSQTTLEKTNACYQNPINTGTNSDNQVLFGVPLLETAYMENKTFDLKDNEVNIKISFYKTRNGDCCVSLPRRFLSNIALQNNTRATQWKIEDSVESGLPFTGQSEQNGGVLVLRSVIGTAGLSKPTRSYFVEDDYIYKKGADSSSGGEEEKPFSFYKLRSDNSRYKIFVSKDTRKAGYITGTGTDAEQDWFQEDGFSLNSPSEAQYIPFEKIITLTAPVGFSSPESLADNLTNQLRKTGDLDSSYYTEWSNNISGETADINSQVRLLRPISVKTECPTYQTFHSFSVNDHNASTYYGFYKPSIFSASGDRFFEYNQYLQNYQYIGIKRPDFYEKGCELSRTMPVHNQDSLKFCHLNTDINASSNTENGRLTAKIEIGHEWTKTNLDAWKAWLDTQGNYPELFTNRNNNYSGITNVNNSRFLHMNLNSYQQGVLGGDNVLPNAWTGEKAVINASSQNSVPLFFDFKPSASNTFTNGTVDNPCYGFAIKKLSPNGSYVISFSTTGLSLWEAGVLEKNPYYNVSMTTLGIPKEYAYYSGINNSGRTQGIITGTYKFDNSLNASAGRVCGFDRHFNSYGNAVIGLADGYLNNDYQNMTHYAVNTLENNNKNLGASIIDATPFAKRIYVGAQEPKFEFSASNQKFNIQQLHTPEYIGNLWNAGIDSASATANTETNPNAQEKVFHINKRINNTNWTTDMLPYSQNYASGISSAYLNSTGTGTVSVTLSRMNDMITPWTVFDTQSGIFIEDFGIPEKSWNNSLWNTLGFTYKQFHSTLSASLNYNTRLNNINKLTLPVVTTNADVDAGDTINFNMNIWGAVNLTPQVPLPALFNGAVTGQTPPFVDNRFPQSFPAISENQNSILIQAADLPTKMTRAYYTIRSDLLDKYTYLGSRDSGEALKTISVVNKINGDGDYYFQQDNPLQFTVTNSKTITNITTQICDPDGQSAQLNNDSCVMYKIDRVIQSSLNPVEELLQATQQKK